MINLKFSRSDNVAEVLDFVRKEFTICYLNYYFGFLSADLNVIDMVNVFIIEFEKMILASTYTRQVSHFHFVGMTLRS